MANISEMGKALTAREFEIGREITIDELFELLSANSLIKTETF